MRKPLGRNGTSHYPYEVRRHCISCKTTVPVGIELHQRNPGGGRDTYLFDSCLSGAVRPLNVSILLEKHCLLFGFAATSCSLGPG